MRILKLILFLLIVFIPMSSYAFFPLYSMGNQFQSSPPPLAVNPKSVVQWGTTAFLNGSAVVNFATGAQYSTSNAYFGYAYSTSSGSTNPTITQTSGTSMKITGGGNNGAIFRWFAIGN